ncbi:MAG: hypothetical protein IJ752_01645 [Alphaproteobacteria bacterium]|nr:hypothetical protein [Alphaproteobacteria bacterium]
MKTAIFWKMAQGVFVFGEDSPVEPPLNMADYSGSHVEKWEELRRTNPDLAGYECENFPRGRLIWDDNQKAYFFYADEKILSDSMAVNAVLNQLGLSRKDYVFHFCRDPHYKTGGAV